MAEALYDVLAWNVSPDGMRTDIFKGRMTMEEYHRNIAIKYDYHTIELAEVRNLAVTRENLDGIMKMRQRLIDAPTVVNAGPDMVTHIAGELQKPLGPETIVNPTQSLAETLNDPEPVPTFHPRRPSWWWRFKFGLRMWKYKHIGPSRRDMGDG